MSTTTTRRERETIIVYNEEEDTALIWSASPIFQRKMGQIPDMTPVETDIRSDVPCLQRSDSGKPVFRQEHTATRENSQLSFFLNTQGYPEIAPCFLILLPLKA